MSLRLREKFNIIELDTVDSTNLYAKANLANLADKSVVCADVQTSGHGRFNRAWIDLGSGNIFMSLVLKPSDAFSYVYPNITQYFSVILCKVLEKYGLHPQIKWPNDVLINGKKIAGILSESVIKGSEFKGLVLGVGINLNASEESLKLIIDKEATALNLELNLETVDRKDFLNKLLDKFFENYDEFLLNGFSMIADEYVKRNCFLGKEISVQVFDEKKLGFAKAINADGELVLEKDGNEFILTMGDIL